MNQDDLREQLAEAIRAGNYEESTRIALDLIEQLEQTIEDMSAENKKLRMKKCFAPEGYPPGHPMERVFQKEGGEG